jgi:hypothetical protein
VAYQKMLKDKQLMTYFSCSNPMRCDPESKNISIAGFGEKNSDYVKKPGRCTNDAAKFY